MTRSARILLIGLLLVAVPVVGLAQAEAEVASPAAAVSPESVVGPPRGRPLAGEELDQRTQELAAIMRCPVCQALSVADSPTASALAMREEARDLLAAGYTEEQVLEYFETSYGEFILLAPKRKGFNWLVWLAPLAALVAGAILVARRLRTSADVDSGDGPESEDDELAAYAQRVRREVSG